MRIRRMRTSGIDAATARMLQPKTTGAHSKLDKT